MLHVEEIRPLRMPESPHHRLVTIGIVVGIHIVVISAFVVGLRQSGLLPRMDKPIVTQWIQEKPTTTVQTPPPPVDLAKPTPTDTVPPQDFKLEDTPDKGVILLPPTPPGPPQIVRDFGPRAMMGTHTIPDYPPIDSRLNHEGTVMLKLGIDERGVVTDAVVEHSSGYDSLDQAAVSWVKAHWRYYPATRAGDAIASSADVTVTFRLTNRN